MIELLISACLIYGDGCRDFAQLYDAHEVSLMTCMTAGQPVIARWQESHSGWAVTRWSCHYADRRKVAL